MESKYRSLPSVDRLLGRPEMAEAITQYSRPVVLEAARQALDEARTSIAAGNPSPGLETLIAAVLSEAAQASSLLLRPVINATGVIIHTNLGRAPLSDEAVAAMTEISGQYSNLEYEIESGERGSRHIHVENLLCRITGAEAGMMVNNNAAAVFLALSALGGGREVIISRSQLVEIGGGFRVPDVMRQSGALLVEVGTTNRTYVRDYESAITPNTALLMRVHSSNFRLIGFTHEVSVAELAGLGERHTLPVLDDIGSGALLDSSEYGLAHEPMPQESIRDGAAVVCFSGDKLLGGPQAGLIVGRKDLITQLKRHPMARALRVDKSTLAAMQVTLTHYLRGEALTKVPVWRMISTPVEELEQRATSWARAMRALPLDIQMVDAESTVGGGSLPGESLPTKALSLRPASSWVDAPSLDELAARLRHLRPAVVGRIEHDRLLLDPRTVLPGQDEALLAAIKRVC